MPKIEIIADREFNPETGRMEGERIGKCSCGEAVGLSGFTNTCPKCGRDYNSSGQELAPRKQWGCETGESLSDILRIP